ncbi:MAG: putative phosphodiesterase [Planctomycetota bacterium]
MYAIVSDLHSNIEALEAVMDDMAQFDVDSIYCLGDVIGYGPDPLPVLEIAKQFKFALMGNHEEGLLFFAEDFNPRARQALEWTKSQITNGDISMEEKNDIWMRIDGMKKSQVTDHAQFVHGSLRQETRDYVMPADTEDIQKMSEIWSLMDRNVCFFGHTHIPGVWTQSGSYIHPEDLDYEFNLPDEKVLINVGSVGQPRDGDNRSSYVIVDGDHVQFRRVAYDFESTMKKIMQIDDLSNTLAARLKVGR